MVDCLQHDNLEEEMGRYDLTDEQYALIEPHPPSNTKKVGHPFGEHRPLINGIFWRLHTGAPWPDIPERYGNWKTIYDRYSTWCRDGTWDKVIPALQLKLDEHGLIDYEQWGLDGTVVRAHRAAAGARKKGAPTRKANQQTTTSDAQLAVSRPKSTS